MAKKVNIADGLHNISLELRN